MSKGSFRKATQARAAESRREVTAAAVPRRKPFSLEPFPADLRQQILAMARGEFSTSAGAFVAGVFRGLSPEACREAYARGITVQAGGGS